MKKNFRAAKSIFEEREIPDIARDDHDTFRPEDCISVNEGPDLPAIPNEARRQVSAYES